MVKYTVKRLLQSVLTVLIIVTVVFLLLRMLPSDCFFTEEELVKLSEQDKEDRLKAAGLKDPLGVQLVRFYGELLHGDLGTSSRIQAGVAVTEIMASKFGVSMRMGLVSLGISLLLGIALGIGQTLNKDRLLDHVGTAYIIFVNAVPGLVSYSLILMFGARVLHLPSLYSVNDPVRTGILPVICLALGSIASYALWTRRYMVDELNKDYIRLARVKGMSSRNIMLKHVLKNAFVPMIAYIPASVLLTIGGSLLVEKFFSVPGMGPLLTDAIGRYDTSVVQACVIIYAGLGILGVFLGDVMMMLFDPRIKLVEGGESR